MSTATGPDLGPVVVEDIGRTVVIYARVGENGWTTDGSGKIVAGMHNYPQGTPHSFSTGVESEAPQPLPGLGLPDLDDGQLLALAKTLDNVHVRWCVRVLAHNRTTPAIREACRRDLREALALGKFDGHCHPDTVDVIDDGSTVEVKCGTCHTVLVEVPR